jgi:homoserine kinase
VLRFAIGSEIPIARGLGSSGAAIAAGVLLARALANDSGVGDETLCDLGFAIEGHPDNTSASILGGCTLSIPRGDGTLRIVRQELHPDLGFAVAWPEAMLSTRAARSVLPREVPFADAVENPRRLAALLEGLRTGDPELLELGSHDRLHVRHRLALIENGERALGAARESGAWLATVSGSGSALFAIGPHARACEIAAALQRELARGKCGSDGARSRVVQAVQGTPVVHGE